MNYLLDSVPYKILAEIARLCSNRVSKNQIKQPDNENELSPPSASRDCYSVLFLIFAGMGADRTHGQRGVRVKYFERLERDGRGRRLFRRRFGIFRNLLLVAGRRYQRSGCGISNRYHPWLSYRRYAFVLLQHILRRDN